MIRKLVVAVCAAVFAIAVAPALLGLHGVGSFHAPYADEVVSVSLLDRSTTNVAGTVAYDVRGFDTLGEEMILFTAAVGIALLLRERATRHRVASGVDRAGDVSRGRDASRPAIRRAGASVLALSIVFGWYMALHATQTPGGGFQGGAIIASAVALVYLGFGYRVWASVMREPALDVAEASGVLGFTAVVAIPVAVAAPIVTNWLPVGSRGAFASGGTMFVINIAIAIAVAAAFLAIVGSLLFDLHEAMEVIDPEKVGT